MMQISNTPKCGFWQPLAHKLTKADLVFVGGKAYAVGSQTYHYRGTTYEEAHGNEDASEFLEQAQQDLAGAGWKFKNS